MRSARAIVGLTLLGFVLALPARSQIKAVSVIQNVNNPIHVCAPPGDDRLFVVGQKGEVRVFENGALLPTWFLDLSGEVHQTLGEQGLLGLVFDPDYATNGYFYVNFTTGAGAGKSIVRRYTVSSNPDSADENSGLQILELTQPATNHNAGNLVFGPDGYLWIAWGDGGVGGITSQSPTTWLGKILRIDPHGDDFPADSLRNYSVPADNPYVSDPGTLDEIWAFGLRNPWRYTFDRLTGDLYLGDVGQNAFEEIDFQPASSTGGENYGWAFMEGTACFTPPTDCNDGSLTLPIHAYAHTLFTNHAVVGGYVYRGSVLPSFLYGHYFFADESWHKIWSFRYENGLLTELIDWSAALDVGPAASIRFPASFWQDDDGELYVVEYRTAVPGEVWKIIPDPASSVPPAPIAGELLLGPARPNPFSAETRFEVVAPAGAALDVGVYDATGRLVRHLHAGTAADLPLALDWDGRDAAGGAAAAGVYFLRAKAGEDVSSRRIALLR
ncbi:MAG: PQQ-dependent sugar dehydrogenase [Candidatus Eiseniibacteriota bacterium]